MAGSLSTMKFAGVVCAAVLAAWAQQGRVAGPVSGFVFDAAARAVRPVLGIPGAAVVGDPLALGYDIQSAWFAPRLDSAIAVAADGAVHVVRLDSGTAAERPANGITVVPQMVAFSPLGSAAALFAGGKLQVVTGLPDAPRGAVTLDLETAPSVGKRPPRKTFPSFAVSDDGSLVLAARGNSIVAFDSGGAGSVVAAASPGALVAFAPGGHDGAVADRANGLVLYRDIAGAANRHSVAAPDEVLAAATGVAFSPDGGRLFVASARSHSVTVFEIASGAKSAVPCDCTPDLLVPMGGAFRLNDPGTGPIWLLDAAAAAPRIVFVPARKTD
jgi:DNA-binding beta-propeller fold protein YncE